MGQKVHPIGIRLGITKDWLSKWYADTRSFPEFVKTDHEIRKNQHEDGHRSRSRH